LRRYFEALIHALAGCILPKTGEQYFSAKLEAF
jgi:hypothetical protein